MSNLYVGDNPLGSVVLTYDTEAIPTEGSKKALTSGGAFNALAEKQDVLAGAEGQLVGFDADGQAIAQDAPSSGLEMALLWENASPNSAFGAQTITIAGLQKYQFIVVGMYGFATNIGGHKEFKWCKLENGFIGLNMNVIFHNGEYFSPTVRNLTYSSDSPNSLIFGNAIRAKAFDGTTVQTKNDTVVPVCIYGIKGVS